MSRTHGRIPPGIEHIGRHDDDARPVEQDREVADGLADVVDVELVGTAASPRTSNELD
jgi:hypothetical protein